MKKSIAAADDPHADPQAHDLARESARYLLDRSIEFGHRRLAVIRLSIAVRTGAVPTPAHWAYCREAVERSCDAALRTLLDAAFAAVGGNDSRGPRAAENRVHSAGEVRSRSEPAERVR